MKKTTLFACLAFACGVFAATYRNPVLTMDFSDPDVCVGPDGRYYMTASSFGGLPGLPILASDDLVNWSYVGYALQRHPWEEGSWHEGRPEHGNAVWAPSIRYRADKGEYVIYWGDPDRGAYRVSAKNPAGPWSEPRLVIKAKGLIDTCPLYDDGRVYLVNGWAQSRAGMNSVLMVRELDADETHAISDPVLVYDGVPEGNFTTEGPKFYKRNGEYWLLFPAGGVPTGWQVAARAKSPFGPYEAKTVMAQGKSKINGPHQGAWVHMRGTGNGEQGTDWFVHFSDRDAYGRIVYLEPMKWQENGWPVIGIDDDGDGCGDPVEEYEMPKGGKLGEQKTYPQLDDEFNEPRLGLQWQYLGKSRADVGFPTTKGFFRLYSTPVVATDSKSFSGVSFDNTWNTPNLLVQKFPAFNFTATMKAQVGAKQDAEEGGLLVQGLDYARIGLKSNGDKFDVVFTVCHDADKGKSEKQKVIASVKADIVGAGIRSAKVKDVWFRVDVRQGAVPPKGLCGAPMCTFSYSLDGQSWIEVNAKSPFKAREGKWIGATVGFYSLAESGCKDRGWIDADWFRVVR